MNRIDKIKEVLNRTNSLNKCSCGFEWYPIGELYRDDCPQCSKLESQDLDSFDEIDLDFGGLNSELSPNEGA